jgi:hypothetical protein
MTSEYTDTPRGANPAPAIRFESLDVRPKDVVQIAVDVWLADVCGAAWATREAMKVAAFIAHYVRTGARGDVSMKDIEVACSMRRDDLPAALTLLKMFGMIDGFTIERGLLTVAGRLAMTQTIKILDLKAKLDQFRPTVAATRTTDPRQIEEARTAPEILLDIPSVNQAAFAKAFSPFLRRN